MYNSTKLAYSLLLYLQLLYGPLLYLTQELQQKQITLKNYNSLMLREGVEEERTVRQENQSGRKLADHISCSRNLDLPPLFSVFPVSSSVWLVLNQEPAAVGRCSHSDDISIDCEQAA